jgi:hypothetical protein
MNPENDFDSQKNHRLTTKLDALKKTQPDILHDYHQIYQILNLLITINSLTIFLLLDNYPIWIYQADSYSNNKFNLLYIFVASIDKKTPNENKLLSYQARIIEEVIISNLLIILSIVLEDKPDFR